MNLFPKGIIPAMVTPLTGENRIKEKILRKLINYMIEGGVHGVFVSGTTGEFYSLRPEEKRKLIQITIEETNGRMPIYAGTGDITTKGNILLTQIAEECGVDAV
jgi:4-hydroxy-tetrahydrodipicolinate synthase